MSHTTPGRKCVVTVGATATFPALVDEVSTPEFLSTLDNFGFEIVEIQCGDDVKRVQDRVHSAMQKAGSLKLKIAVFNRVPDLWRHYVDCRGSKDHPAGVVIGHAGTGTVSEVTAREVPLIIVPNPDLMDNHQQEFAESVAEQYPGVVLGRLGQLSQAIPQILTEIQIGGLDNLAEYQEPPFPVPDAHRFTMLDWMVLTCYPEEFAAQMRVDQLDQDARPKDEATHSGSRPLSVSAARGYNIEASLTDKSEMKETDAQLHLD